MGAPIAITTCPGSEPRRSCNRCRRRRSPRRPSRPWWPRLLRPGGGGFTGRGAVSGAGSQKRRGCQPRRGVPGAGLVRTFAIVAALDQSAMPPANIARITVPVCSCAIRSVRCNPSGALVVWRKPLRCPRKNERPAALAPFRSADGTAVGCTLPEHESLAGAHRAKSGLISRTEARPAHARRRRSSSGARDARTSESGYVIVDGR